MYRDVKIRRRVGVSVAVVVGCGDRGQVLNVSSLALAERKGREGCGWRDRVRFSQQLRTAAKAISKMEILRRSWRRVKSLLGVRRGREDSEEGSRSNSNSEVPSQPSTSFR